jgi:hypothetical protein
MAELFVRHSLNSRFTAKLNITVKSLVPLDNYGEQLYTIEVGTRALDINSNSISPVYVNDILADNLEDAVEEAINTICNQIDWGVLDEDRYGPYLTYFTPTGDDVPIKSKVVFIIKDDVPSAGIDLANMKVIFNNGEVDFDITQELTIKGDPYEYTLEWVPPNING